MPANLKFYMTPGSCSTGIHILLEELGLVFEAYIVNLPAGEQYQPEFVALNPKSSIPVLVKPDGVALTEFPAIAYWLARSYPGAGLLPGEVEGDTLALETICYVVDTLHGQGYARIFLTEQYTGISEEFERVRAEGYHIVKKGFALLNRQLADRDYVVGRYSIADAALFYVEFWAQRLGISLPTHCLAHYQRMLRRPAVKQVLMEEGYASVYR